MKSTLRRRNTPAKKTILSMLESMEYEAMSQDMIEEKMKGNVDRVTIYRILNSFCEDGIVHKVVSDEGKNYFALCNKCDKENHYHDHFHFKCIKCQKVECLMEEVTIKLPKGYQSENVNCWVSGYCSDCK